jgi:hypothetical protein
MKSYHRRWAWVGPGQGEFPPEDWASKKGGLYSGVFELELGLELPPRTQSWRDNHSRCRPG